MIQIASVSVWPRRRWGHTLLAVVSVIAIGMTTIMQKEDLGIPIAQIGNDSCRKHTASDKLLLAAREFRRRLGRLVGLDWKTPAQLLAEAKKKFDPDVLDSISECSDAYTYVTSGTCADAGAIAIITQDQCSRAAEYLEKRMQKAKRTGIEFFTKVPAGCHWNTQSQKLWFNPKGEAHATTKIHLLCQHAKIEAEQKTARRRRRNRRAKPEPTSPKPIFGACKHRLRKDWVDLTDAEQALYFAALNKLKKTPYGVWRKAGPGRNMYDAFVMIHENIANKAYAHEAAGFLSWHRKYLIEFETALRSVDPRFKCVTIPYWDWSTNTFECQRAGNPFAEDGVCETYDAMSQLLRDFGGTGDPNKTKKQGANTFGSAASGPVGCVTSGPFKGWVDHAGHCLSRGVDWDVRDQKPFTGRIRLAEILQTKRFGSQEEEGFRVVLEGTPHGGVHNYLGGHMRSFLSPADPIFFSHHGYIDKIWAVWQDCHDYDTNDITKKLKTMGHDKSLFAFYQPTNTYGPDNIDDPMIFNFPAKQESKNSKSKKSKKSKKSESKKSKSINTKCSKENSQCEACLGDIDIFCRVLDWDHTCSTLCTNKLCAEKCGTPPEEVINMNERGQEVLRHWVLDEATPAHMHSVHLLGERSYTYAPDEFERHLEQEEPAALGGCLLDSHKNAQRAFGLLEEASRFHHSDAARGTAAREHAQMIRKAFNETRDNLGRRLGTEHLRMFGSHVFKASMGLAQQKECQEMAQKCGDYKKEFKCKTDQPRFWAPWMGKGWQVVMDKPELKKKVFQDPCCDGDDDALKPAVVPAYE